MPRKKRNRKKSGRASTQQPSEPPNERQDPSQDMAASGTASNVVIHTEGNTIYIRNADNVDVHGDVNTVVAGDVHHHYQHASGTAQQQGAQANIDETKGYKEVEIEAMIEPTTKSNATETGGAGVVADSKILQTMQKIFASFHNVEKWAENAQLCQELVKLFKQQGNAALTKVRFDSVHFFVRVRIGTDYDTFLRSCTDGTLSRGLTKLLVTSELEQAAGVKLRINLDVKEAPHVDDTADPGSDATAVSGSDATADPGSNDAAVLGSDDTVVPGSDATVVPGSDATAVPGSGASAVPGSDATAVPGSDDTTFEGLDDTTVPGSDATAVPCSDATADTAVEGADIALKRLEEMSPIEVKNWLVRDKDIPISVAERLEKEGIDGKLLARYDCRDLKEDFQLSTGIMRRIVYARDDHIKAYSEHVYSPTSERGFREPKRSQENEPVTQNKSIDSHGSQVEEDSTKSFGRTGRATRVEVLGITEQHDLKQEDEIQGRKRLVDDGRNISSRLPLMHNVTRALDDRLEADSSEQTCSLSSEGSIVESQNRKEKDRCTEVRTVGSNGSKEVDDTPQNDGSVEVHEIIGHQDLKQDEGVQQRKRQAGVGKDSAHSPQLTKEEESADEAKLRFLLTGDENGSLDSSFHPILVVNKPMLGGSETDKLKNLQENLDFVSFVNWNAVFDCNAKSLMNGVCAMVENKREVKLLLPETFHKEPSTEELEFNVVPSWIFANGREDLEDIQSPSLASDWNEKYGADVDRAVDFFATTAIPKERAVIVFLILSGDNIQIMSDIFKKFQSSLQGSGTFTFIVENRELYESWADEVKKWIPRDQLDKRSFIGKEFKRINYYIKKQYGQVTIAPVELPFSAGKSCILPEKTRSKWLNIEVLPRNECENTAMDEDSPGFQKFVSEKELAFYQGNAVSWWNFRLSEDNAKKTGFNQVLRREASKTLNKLVKAKLNPTNPNDGSKSIVTITVFQEPGSGASTSAKQVLWDFHRKLRCVIVKRAIMSTVEDILEVRQYGYGQKDEIPPVLVLLDDMDDAEVIDLIAQLETATSDYGCLSCIMLHCKRTPDPGSVAENNGVNSVVIGHKLNSHEHRWFEEKFKEYGEEYRQKPEKLIGFMVMKEECNPDYIRRIVTNILREVEGREAKLLKYIAVINRFKDDFGIPVSCCDVFMGASRKIRTSRGRHKLKYVPWENLLSNPTCLLLIQTNVHTSNGPTKAIKLVNPVLATEVVKQLIEEKNQTIGNIIRELINDSHILDSKAYTNKYMTDKIRELLVRRMDQSQFSPLIEHLLTEDKDMAFLLLQEASEKFKNGLIAQQLARLYKSQGNLVEAERYAEMAVTFQSRPFFWDTRGRIVIDEMKKYSKKNIDTQLDSAETSRLKDLLDKGMKFFKTCQDLQRMESSQSSNYAAYSGELKVIFHFVQVMEQRVRPFCLSSEMQSLKNYFLTDEDIPGLDEFWSNHRQHLQNLPKRAAFTLDHIGDLLTYSKGITRTKQDPQDEVRMRNHEKIKFFEDFLRVFTMDKEEDPPNSVQENPDSMCSWRRAKVKAMKADSFHDIFKLAQNGNRELLKKVQCILNANQPKNTFDLRILVCISFALSSLGEDGIDYDSVIRQVQKLNETDHSLYGAFFTMILAWPTGNLTTGSGNVGLSTEKAVVKLRGKWNDLQCKSSQKRAFQSAYERSLPRHHTIVRKPLTYFLLAKGEGLQAFVHVNMFRASQSTLEGEKLRFWMRREVTERLVRLEGTILDRERVLFRTPSKEQIYIKLSSRWHNQPSQEKVSFYLGFNFAGPVAYNVFERERNPVPVQVKDYRETFPRYLVGQLSRLQRKEQDLVDRLEEIDYMTKKRRNRQQHTAENKKLMQTKPHLEEELRTIRAQIKEEIDNNSNDDDDELFCLVGKRGKQRMTSSFL